jgi:hypothetical protein
MVGVLQVAKALGFNSIELIAGIKMFIVQALGVM